MPSFKHQKPEQKLQRQIVEELRRQHWAVFVTSQANHFGRMRASTSLPDLFCRNHRLPKGLWIALEVKAEWGRLTPEQEILETLNAIHVVYSVQDAINALHPYA